MKGILVQGALRVLEGASRAVHGRERFPQADNAPGKERRPVPEHLISGRQGEDEAYFYLRRQGYTIVGRNYRARSRRGEADLIGWDGPILCFIEVKTRSTRDVKPAEAAVDRAKQRELREVANQFRRQMPSEVELRFDIVTVYCDVPGDPPQITLFKNAFSVS